MSRITENRREENALSALTDLVRESQHMTPGATLEVSSLLDTSDVREKRQWEKLVLDKRGLREDSGWEVRCHRVPRCGVAHESGTNKPRRVKPSRKLVRKYSLTAIALRQKLQELL